MVTNSIFHTCFIKAPDVSWNKPIKERIRHFYNAWTTTGDGMSYTAAGNPRPWDHRRLGVGGEEGGVFACVCATCQACQFHKFSSPASRSSIHNSVCKRMARRTPSKTLFS